MPRFIEDTCSAVTRSINSLSKIAKQLAIANKLKVLELEIKNGLVQGSKAKEIAVLKSEICA